jgi:hypothetical protein
VIAAGIALLVVFRPREESSGRSPPSAPPIEDSIEHVNSEGGYAFSYPPSWELTDEGTTSKLTSPDSTAIVSFGLGAEGGLQRASDRFVASLEGAYDDLEISGTDETAVGGHPAITVSGRATNDSGVRILIQAITIAAPSGNYAISAFTAEDVEAAVLSMVQEVIGSFRPPGASPS